MSDFRLNNVHNTIYYLTENTTKNWKTLLEYSETLDLATRREFMWVWPSESDFREIKTLFENCGIYTILSIGCGNGLFEWLCKEIIGTEFFGLEVDKKWWLSPYSIKNFIEVSFAEDMIMDTDFLQTCCKHKNRNFALLFCYFNNRGAFLNYLRHYRGRILILLGPNTNGGIHTDPEPLQPNIPETYGSWEMRHKLNIKENNVLAIYMKM